MSVLSRNGFECVPQVGVAGFFIDIAVRDPGKPSRYLMGIECDGATYHSAKSVRDRDRLRQSVLENLGWRIRRIWSTDWFKNPEAEIQVIVRELNQRKSLPPPPPPPEMSSEGKKDGQHELPFDTVVEEQPEIYTADAEADPLDLREALTRIDQDVIAQANPETPDSQRLLRPAMLEALLEFRPTTRTEFVERLPHYLRQGTRASEGGYLDQVLRIIENAEIEG